MVKARADKEGTLLKYLAKLRRPNTRLTLARGMNKVKVIYRYAHRKRRYR